MIHSLAGGVIRDCGSYVFVKVAFEGVVRPYWYICEYEVHEGDAVTAPVGGAVMRGTVIRVEENVNGQVTPVPLRSAKRIISVEHNAE